MKCPQCQSSHLQKLPANDITRNPGWLCGDCQLVMRHSKSPAKDLVFLVVGPLITLSGIGMIALFAVDQFVPGLLKGSDDFPYEIAPFLLMMIVGGIVATRWVLRERKKPHPVTDRKP